MTRPLQDQVVVITGASSGIGRETALQFAEKGSRVVLAARNEHGLGSLATAIRNNGGRALEVPTDVTSAAQVERLADRAVEHFGRIDTWVNNAAVSLYAGFEESTLEEMRQVMEVIYWGNVHGLKAAIPRMKQSGGGTIICVGSVLSDASVPLQSAYCSAKHALRGLTESVRMELQHEGIPIAITLLKPPSVDTPLFRHARTKLGVEPKPLRPVYDPSVVARAILHCAVTPERELLIGGTAEAFSLMNRLAPRLLDWQQVKTGVSQQRTDSPKPQGSPDNLFGPIQEHGSARETGDGWKVSWVTWLREHPRASLAGAAAIATAALLRRRL